MFGCQRRVPEPQGDGSDAASTTSATSSAAPASAEPPPASSALPLRLNVASEDPLHGQFGLEQATVGLAGSGSLYAVMTTSQGQLVCELWPDKAPNTVANFVGLARGLRPFWKNDGWVKAPLYDGSEIYSVIKGFAFEGGSASERYNERIGYFITDELWAGAKHDKRGLLCMRPFSPNHNGSQFMILDGKVPQLDHSNTIFGQCGPVRVLGAIAGVPVQGARPTTKLEIKKVEIVRSKTPPKGT